MLPQRTFLIALCLISWLTINPATPVQAKHISATIDKNGILLDYELGRHRSASVQINQQTSFIRSFFGFTLSIRVLDVKEAAADGYSYVVADISLKSPSAYDPPGHWVFPAPFGFLGIEHDFFNRTVEPADISQDLDCRVVIGNDFFDYQLNMSFFDILDEHWNGTAYPLQRRINEIFNVNRKEIKKIAYQIKGLTTIPDRIKNFEHNLAVDLTVIPVWRIGTSILAGVRYDVYQDDALSASFPENDAVLNRFLGAAPIPLFKGTTHVWADFALDSKVALVWWLADFMNATAPAGADADNDGAYIWADNCPAVYNPGQADADGDGIGDACAH